MSIPTNVNRVCNQIHELVQSSGLHFVINQTTWSSYITIRRKFVDPKSAHDVKSSVAVYDELVDLREKNKLLENRVNDLERELVDTQEEDTTIENRAKETIKNLHSKIETLDCTVAAFEFNLKKKGTAIVALEKKIVVKDEIIQNINAGFNEKVAAQKVEIEGLENALKKEKKILKRLRQKVKSQENVATNENVAVNHNPVGKLNETFDCEICEKVFESKSEVEDHAVTEHLEEHSKIASLFNEHNSASLRLLENVAEQDFILTPEEITQLGVDWDIHFKILEIIKAKNQEKQASEE